MKPSGDAKVKIKASETDAPPSEFWFGVDGRSCSKFPGSSVQLIDKGFLTWGMNDPESSSC